MAHNVSSVVPKKDSSGDYITGTYRVTYKNELSTNFHNVFFDQAWGWHYFPSTSAKDKTGFDFLVKRATLTVGSNNKVTISQDAYNKLILKVTGSSQSSCETQRADDMLNTDNNYLSLRFIAVD